MEETKGFRVGPLWTFASLMAYRVFVRSFVSIGVKIVVNEVLPNVLDHLGHSRFYPTSSMSQSVRNI